METVLVEVTMKILMLCDNYVPEMNANARIFSEIAEQWSEQDEDVTVITCHPNFPKEKFLRALKTSGLPRKLLIK